MHGFRGGLCVKTWSEIVEKYCHTRQTRSMLQIIPSEGNERY